MSEQHIYTVDELVALFDVASKEKPHPDLPGGSVYFNLRPGTHAQVRDYLASFPPFAPGWGR